MVVDQSVTQGMPPQAGRDRGKASMHQRPDAETSFFSELGAESTPEGLLRLTRQRLGRGVRFVPGDHAAHDGTNPGSGVRLPVRLADLLLGWLEVGGNSLSPQELGMLNASCRLLASSLWEFGATQALWHSMLEGAPIEPARLQTMFRLRNWPPGVPVAVLALRRVAADGPPLPPCKDYGQNVSWVEHRAGTAWHGSVGGLVFSRNDVYAAFVPADTVVNNGADSLIAFAGRFRLDMWTGASKQVSVGIGGIAGSFANVPRLWADAYEVLRWGEVVLGPGCVAQASNLGLIGVLIGHVPAHTLVAYAHGRLEPLLRYDGIHGSELYRTLGVFLQQEGNAITASRQLFVHYNTLRHRLRRIEELLGADLGSLAVRMDLWACVQITKLYPPRTGEQGGY